MATFDELTARNNDFASCLFIHEGLDEIVGNREHLRCSHYYDPLGPFGVVGVEHREQFSEDVDAGPVVVSLVAEVVQVNDRGDCLNVTVMLKERRRKREGGEREGGEREGGERAHQLSCSNKVASF